MGPEGIHLRGFPPLRECPPLRPPLLLLSMGNRNSSLRLRPIPRTTLHPLRHLIGISSQGTPRVFLTTATCHHGYQEKLVDMGLAFPMMLGCRQISADMALMPLMTAGYRTI